MRGEWEQRRATRGERQMADTIRLVGYSYIETDERPGEKIKDPAAIALIGLCYGGGFGTMPSFTACYRAPSVRASHREA